MTSMTLPNGSTLTFDSQDELTAYIGSTMVTAPAAPAPAPAPATKATNGKAKANGKPAPTPNSDATLAWIYRAIDFYRAADSHKSKGIHTVISGFNGAFRMKFAKDPVDVTKAYVSAGLLQCHPARKGAMLYKAGEMPAATRRPADYTTDLQAIG